MTKKRRYMNKLTDEFLDLIYQEEAYSISIESFLSMAECEDDPAEYLKSLLENWAREIVFKNDSPLDFFVRENIIPWIDFQVLALVLLDNEGENNDNE